MPVVQRSLAPPGLRPLPWRRLVVVALVGAGFLGALVGASFVRQGEPLTNLLSPGVTGPAVELIRSDFPSAPLMTGAGDDGQQFYAIARDPFHLRATARYLDRPRYRLQRIGYPALAWALHPTGGGRALIWALVAGTLLGVAVGCLALGALAAGAGRSPAWGLAFALLPGTYTSLRLATADALAAALALAAVALLERRRLTAAALAAVAAVLTKESTYLVVLGVGISVYWYRRTDVRAFLLAPLAAASSWWIVLRLTVPVGPDSQYVEFGYPFEGLLDAVSSWTESGSTVTALFFAVTLVFAIAAVVLNPRSIFTLAIALQLGLILVLSRPALVFLESMPRNLLPLSALTAAAIVARRPVAA